jgi:hypothetical protein
MSDGEIIDFNCAAYGPEGREVGALCFVSGDRGKRVCASLIECHVVMAAERQRVFRRIRELAAAGDPVCVELAREFTDPGQLLGGDDSTGEDGDG